MELALEIVKDGQTQPVTVGTDLADPSDVARAVALVGRDPVLDLARGEWNPIAAKAMIYVNILRAMEADFVEPPFLFENMTLDWGDLTPYMNPDPEMESALADLSEEVSE